MDQPATDADAAPIAGVLARPIFMFPLVLMIGLALDHVIRFPFPIARTGAAHWISAALGGAMVVAGVLTFAAGVRGFSRAATPLPTNKPATSLVTTGVYGWSRNPIYLAFFLAYVGLGLLVRSSWVLILTAPLWTIIFFGVVRVEEKYLRGRFGGAYESYKQRVRRWL